MLIESELTPLQEFTRGSGLGRGDETSYHAAQRAWGTTRRHYAPVMFDFERLGRTNPIYNIDRRWEHRDRVVIDYWLEPVRSVNDMPTALSSNFEGDYMEPIARIDSRITIRDFIARMYVSHFGCSVKTHSTRLISLHNFCQASSCCQHELNSRTKFIPLHLVLSVFYFLATRHSRTLRL